MNANVTFKIGEVEIKVEAGIPQLQNIDKEGKDNMTINNAISKVRRETGIDLMKKYPNIKENVTVDY